VEKSILKPLFSTRDELVLKHIESAIKYYKTLSRRFTIKDISILTGFSEERILETLEKQIQ
jgi:hypothetical protein